MNYPYLLTDFPNNKVDLNSLTKEINDSTITNTLDFINSSEIGVDIFFDGDLSVGDKTKLDTIIANHQGNPLVEAQKIIDPIEVEGGLFVYDTSGTGLDYTIAAIDASGKLIDTGYKASVYGTEFHLAQSLGASTTSSRYPQTKATLVTNDLPAGKYKMEISWLANHTSQANDMRFDILLNGVSHGIVSEIGIEAKDTDSIYPFRRVFYNDLEGINTIQFRYWNENSSTTVSDVTIELIRVL